MKKKNGTKALGHYDTKFTLAYLLQKIRKDLKSHRKFQATRRNFGDSPSTLVPEYPSILKRSAFTLAEVLITLAIIGIVSALVIPSVLKNYNDRKYNTARLKALKTFGEAGKLASINGEINGQPTARAFVENVLSKYLKITKVCDKAQDCNFPTSFKAQNHTYNLISNNYKSWANLHYVSIKDSVSKVNVADTNLSIYIITNDGFSAKVFYNPNCINYVKSRQWLMALDAACLDIIYDMNGNKIPNILGKDIGLVTTFWSGIKTTSVAPSITNIIEQTNKNYSQAIQFCEQNSLGNIKYSLPNAEELESILLHRTLFQLATGQCFWTNTMYEALSDWMYVVDDYYTGVRVHATRNWQTCYNFCVRH